MRIKGSLQKIDPKTKGYELDQMLTTLFGQGSFVMIYVDPNTKEFWATDEESGHMIPVGYQLFSAGKVGVRQVHNAPNVTTGDLNRGQV